MQETPWLGGTARAGKLALQMELQMNSRCRRGVPPQPWPCFLILSFVQMPGEGEGKG